MITPANYHDSKAVGYLVNHISIKKPNYEQHINLDTAYDSKEVRDILINKHYISHIPVNKRNSKQEPPQMTQEEKLIYKDRIHIEHFFGKLKQYKSFLVRFVRKLDCFQSFLYVAMGNIIANAVSNI